MRNECREKKLQRTPLSENGHLAICGQRAPDQPVHSHHLICEPHCSLFSVIGTHFLIIDAQAEQGLLTVATYLKAE